MTLSGPLDWYPNAQPNSLYLNRVISINNCYITALGKKDSLGPWKQYLKTTRHC